MKFILFDSITVPLSEFELGSNCLDISRVQAKWCIYAGSRLSEAKSGLGVKLK